MVRMKQLVFAHVLDYETVKSICCDIDSSGNEISIALYNSPSQIVVGGTECKNSGFIEKAQGYLPSLIKKVNVDHVFHTPLMKYMVKDFEKYVNNISMQPPHTKLWLNCMGVYASQYLMPEKTLLINDFTWLIG